MSISYTRYVQTAELKCEEMLSHIAGMENASKLFKLTFISVLLKYCIENPEEFSIVPLVEGNMYVFL